MPLLGEPSSCSMPKKCDLFFENLSASERESEEHGLKENSRTIKIDHLPHQEPHVLLPDLSPPIHRIEKGKMRGGVARAHDKSPSVVKQKAAECYDTRQEAQHC
jgi:hypothetical protein